MKGLNFKAKPSLSDPTIKAYPCDKKVIVIFELVGDVDDAEASNQIKFGSSGNTLRHWTCIPKAWQNERSLVGSKATMASGTADTFILHTAIKERTELAEDHGLVEEDGYIWEPHKVLGLPFCCEPVLFNKHNKEIGSFLMQVNEHSHKWGYFWLMGSGVHAGTAKKSIFTCEEDEDMSDTVEVQDNDASEATEVCNFDKKRSSGGDRSGRC